jgi:hypothetical protein
MRVRPVRVRPVRVRRYGSARYECARFECMARAIGACRCSSDDPLLLGAAGRELAWLYRGSVLSALGG